MKPATVDSIDAYSQAEDEIQALLRSGDAAGAIAFAESLVAGSGHEPNVMNLRAYSYIEGGSQLKRLDWLEVGAQILCKLTSQTSVDTTYNLASVKLEIWQLAVDQTDIATAWRDRRSDLHEARELFKLVADDDGAPNELRLKAHTDVGNSYDIVGRHIDALDHYDRALRIEPAFGMALGNRGIALLNVSPLMGPHQSHVLGDAATDLDAAIQNRESVLQAGGQSAFDQFVNGRSRIIESKGPTDSANTPPASLGDPYLDWCLSNGLFLHPSMACIHADVGIIDSIGISRIKSGSSREDIERTNEIINAFNAVKQDFIAARYLAWLAFADESLVRDHTRKVTRRTSFIDTLTYTRWGTRTGIAVQAHKSAVDVLDKIASFVHLYLDSGRVRNVSFRSLPYAKASVGDLDQTIADAIDAPEANRALLALADLSSDLDNHLEQVLQRRHAATHRFLVIHSESPIESSNWSQHTNWYDHMDESVFQLRLARSAGIYLAQMIDIRERALAKASPSAGLVMPWDLPRTDTDLVES